MLTHHTVCCYELSYDIQIGTLSASFRAAPKKDKRDLTKVSIIFVAKNMPQNLVSRHAVTSYLGYEVVLYIFTVRNLSGYDP